jgi:YjbE family integral membrane protein
MEQFATPQFWLAVGQIIIIDILLAGDNAVVIALACRNLPAHLQRRGIFWGAAGAIILRIILTAFAATLLTLPWLKLIGGVLLLWIGVKLIAPQGNEEHNIQGSSTLRGAIKTIIVADFVMSLDNVIAVAGAAKGDFFLLVFGLIVSIPLVIIGSQLVLKMIQRFPAVVIAGGALLGWIAGELIVTDPALAAWTGGWPEWSKYAAAVVGAVFVLVLAKVIEKRQSARREAA